MRTIPLTHGMVALVDDDMYEFLMQWKWYAVRSRNTYYAQRSERRGLFYFTVSMHNQIMNPPLGVQVDHRNGNGLDNRRENIRLATHAENQHNQAKQSRPTSSRYKGVCWHRLSGKWEAYIKTGGKKIHLGLFSDQAEAARAYDRAAVEHHGEFARTNFPQP